MSNNPKPGVTPSVGLPDLDTNTTKDLREKIKEMLERRDKIPEKIKTFRENLPIFEEQQSILEAIRSNQVVLIKGETGSGKTTQVPQYILEDCIQHKKGHMTNILVTQPRRISAVSVAKRVAEERGEKINQNDNSQVGGIDTTYLDRSEDIKEWRSK